MSGVGEYFSSIFGKSPFKPIQEHVGICVQAAARAVELIEAAAAADFEAVAGLQREISRLEGEADELKSEIRSNLPRGFLLPVARADLLDLLTRQDNIANRAEDIAGIVHGRQMTFPEPLREALLGFARVSLRACEQADAVVNELDELIESSFTGREASRVVIMIGEVERWERESDTEQVNLRQLLFPLEQTLAPVDVIFLYQVIDLIGDLADMAERVGHRVKMMLAR
jgi:predicted phosphate transport protein (TIGR00153 family)